MADSLQVKYFQKLVYGIRKSRFVNQIVNTGSLTSN